MIRPIYFDIRREIFIDTFFFSNTIIFKSNTANLLKLLIFRKINKDVNPNYQPDLN